MTYCSSCLSLLLTAARCFLIPPVVDRTQHIRNIETFKAEQVSPTSYRTGPKQPHPRSWFRKRSGSPLNSLHAAFHFQTLVPVLVPRATSFSGPDGPSLSSLKSLLAIILQKANSTSFESVVITSVKAAHMWRTRHQSYSTPDFNHLATAAVIILTHTKQLGAKCPKSGILKTIILENKHTFSHPFSLFY